jgi:hypothetical protein
MLPPLRTTITGRMVSELLFDPLVEIGPALNVFGDAGFAPGLARRWEWSADSLTVTFALDPAARWHDGHAVVAQDVASGLAAIREPANGSALLSDLTEIDSVHAIDDSTVSVHFRTRSPEQIYTVSLLHPLPSHLVDTIPAGGLATSAFAQRPVGSGQFRFVSREPKVRLELAAVESHYRGRPAPDRVALVISDQPSTAIAKVWSEEADVWDVLPPPDVAEAAKNPHVRLVKSYSFDYSFIAFNFRDPRDTSRAHPLLRDVRLRRAIALGVDAAGVRQAIFDSLARPVLGPFARAQFSADTTIAAMPFDTDRQPSVRRARLDGVRCRQHPHQDGRRLAARARARAERQPRACLGARAGAAAARRDRPRDRQTRGAGVRRRARRRHLGPRLRRLGHVAESARTPRHLGESLPQRSRAAQQRQLPLGDIRRVDRGRARLDGPRLGARAFPSRLRHDQCRRRGHLAL